jgi:hypothetical protein
MALTDKLASIADAIREVGGTTAKLTPAEMPDAIAKLGESGYPTLVMYQGQPFTLTADLAKADGAAWEMPSTDTLALHMWHGADTLDASGSTATLSVDVPADAVLKTWHWTLVLTHGGTEYMVALGDAECRADGKAKERRVDGFVDKCREVKSGQGSVSKWFAYMDAALAQVANSGNQNALVRAARYPACASVGGSAFNGCTSLASVELPACASVGGSAFNGCASLASVELTACKSVGGYAFYGCTSLASVELPACASINDYAFRSCASLASVELPACASVGDAAFSGCASLASVELPACKSVGGYGFYCCASLASVELPACASVGGSAFYGCTSLASVELPACKTLGNDSFAYCSRIKELVLPGDEMCVLTGGNCFNGCVSTNDGTLRIYVADALVDDYKSATNWSAYAKYIYPISERPEKTPDTPDAPTGWDD